VLVEGQKVLPTRLLKEGFEFRFPRIREALRDILADNRTAVPGQGHVQA
jgi:NAD dependent epimerase/dehydratase family enzyme